MEIAQAKKENDAYLERVEQSKQFEKMEERKGDSAAANTERQKVRRSFVQKTPTSSKQTRSLADDSGLLEKVFKKRKVE